MNKMTALYLLAQQLHHTADDDQVANEVVEKALMLIEAMEKLTPDARIVIFQALGDFFCPRCGISQPGGDCQCGKL